MEKKIVKPVLFMAFNRPEKTRKVFAEIRKARPSKLYLSVDGPRNNYDQDKEKVEEVKAIVSEIDWDCDVKKLFHEKNLGCTLAGKTAFDWIFSQEEEMIELEDDVIPSQSFFWYCQELLDKYKDNPKVAYISSECYGFKSGEATYHFSRYGGSWGFATWKRVYDLFEYKLETLETYLKRREFKKAFHTKFQFEFWRDRFNYWKYIGGNTYDLQYIYLVHKYDMVFIVPNINLVTNIGWDMEASNTFASKSDNPLALKFGNKERFEISEIKHPSEISLDKKVDTLRFNFHFKRKPKWRYRLSWYIKPLFIKLKNKLLGK